MLNPLRYLRRRIGAAAREEDGAATIPFVIFVPFFLMLVMSSIEMGMLMIRHVMLERALDVSVRGLRLGYWTPPTHEELKRAICNNAGIIPDCMNTVLVELRPVSQTTWQPLSSGAICADRAQPPRDPSDDPNDEFDFIPGNGDDMMLIRACAKFDPLFPLTGLGFQLPKDNTGAYALVSATAYVIEPTPGS
jgi:hypothetical protein